MNAKELRDKYQDAPHELFVRDDERTIFLRAIDLLARVEESEDELVRELRRPRVSHHQISADGDPYETATRTHPVDPVRLKAAAALVALRDELTDVYCKLGTEQIESATLKAAKEKAEAERDRLKECVWKLRGEILDMASRGMYTQKSAEAAEDAFALLRNTTEEE